ncbi:MAG: hypothetical protein ACE5IY_19905 [bacterium]
MQTKQITIRVTLDAARVYESASEQERRKLDVLLSLKLCEARGTPRSLNEIMREASQEARERGLTEDLLRELLDD